MDDLMTKWLWMKAMEYAIETLTGEYRRFLYPMERYDEWKNVGFREIERNVLTYALEHWTAPAIQGRASSHTRYSIGTWFNMDGQGVSEEYKGVKVKISWPQVKTFIRQMLDFEPEDKQITMFELLAQGASIGD